MFHINDTHLPCLGLVQYLQPSQSSISLKSIYATNQVARSVRERILIRLTRQFTDMEARKYMPQDKADLNDPFCELFSERLFPCTHLYSSRHNHTITPVTVTYMHPQRQFSQIQILRHYHDFGAAFVTATPIVITVTTITNTTINHILHPYCRHRGLSVDNPCASKSLRVVYLSRSPPHRE